MIEPDFDPPSGCQDTIRRAIALMTGPDDVVEMRAINVEGAGTASGYYNKAAELVRDALLLTRRAEAVWVTLNPVHPDLLGRAQNKYRKYAKNTTQDRDILRRQLLLIDCDKERPAGISANEEEHEAALARARQIRGFLYEQGWPEPIYADSGNGGHLLYRVDLPNDPGAKALIEAAYAALGARFSTDGIKLDPANANASRCCKLYGTLARKGDSIPNRPHRLTRIIEAPECLEVVPLESLRAIAAMKPVPAARRAAPSAPRQPITGRGDYRTLDIVAYFQHLGLYGRDLDGGKHAVLCPQNHLHSDNRGAEASDTVIYEDGEKGPGFHCSHSHCTELKLWDIIQQHGGADRFCTEQYQSPLWRTAFSLDREESGLPAAPTTAFPDSSAATTVPDLLQDEMEAARALVLELPARLKEDPGFPFTDEGRRALGLLQALDKAAWARAKSALQKARVSVRDLLTVLPKPSEFLPGSTEATHLDGAPARCAGDFLTDCPKPDLIIPYPYILSDYETDIQEDDGDGPPRTRTVAYAPILIEGILEDADEGTAALLLTWRRNERWRRLNVARGTAFTARKLQELTSAYFPVADDNAKSVTAYLHRLEAANAHHLPVARVSSRLGWQGRQQDSGFLWGHHYLPPDGSPPQAIRLEDLEPAEWDQNWVAFHGQGGGDEALASGFLSQGSLDGWLEAVSVVQHYPRALLALYAAFVPPLLEILGAPNFIIDWANRTSTGKTTTLRVVASVWGVANELQDNTIIHSWDATRVYVERAGALLSGLPLILDDTKRARNPAAIAEALYTIGNGRGRGRGNIQNLAHTRSFRTVLFSTGEAPATSYTEDGGTRTRCMEIRGLPFGAANAQTGRLVAQLNTGVTAHYGHAGPLFVQWLQEHRGKWGEFAGWYRQTAEHYGKSSCDPEGARLANYAAAIACAAQLAHEAIPFPWRFTNPLEVLWAAILAEGAEASGGLRALQDVLSWSYQNQHTFYGRIPTDLFLNARAGTLSMSGRWDSDEDWGWIGFYPRRLVDLLEQWKFIPTAIFNEWRERGWLITDNDNRKRFEKKIRIPGTADDPRMIVIRREAFEGGNSGNTSGNNISYSSGTD